MLTAPINIKLSSLQERVTLTAHKGTSLLKTNVKCVLTLIVSIVQISLGSNTVAYAKMGTF